MSEIRKNNKIKYKLSTTAYAHGLSVEDDIGGDTAYRPIMVNGLLTRTNQFDYLDIWLDIKNALF